MKKVMLAIALISCAGIFSCTPEAIPIEKNETQNTIGTGENHSTEEDDD
ncbi:hypothetical protein LX97_00906 [Nonlabens dokdonensis]|uniref:Uncharacterized protein n=2 Tax=Nonlabens dokdonensis TaxID=328515 RepID=L7W7P9_NONDD|nr:hypothetical protein [Nonlabens dokdonensis]AGC76237.1 hypothetical protein DDD_1110 [Nonlabens dokdonensis DSW-6]PZX43901.1 hypothetical protein LX97_00906 [Nonlabens dokdonensis]